MVVRNGHFGLIGFSPTQKFPQAEFAPYPSINYEWNSMVCYQSIV